MKPIKHGETVGEFTVEAYLKQGGRMPKQKKRKKEETRVLGFEFSEDTIFCKVTKDRFEKLVTLLRADDTKARDDFVLDLPRARVSSTEDATAVVSMRNPDVKWLLGRWRAEG